MARNQTLTSGLYDLFYRNYDPVLGRFAQVDPLADKYGSHRHYNYGFNDPVFWNDPLGDDAGDKNHGFDWWNYNSNGELRSNSAREALQSDMYGSGFAKLGMLGTDWNAVFGGFWVDSQSDSTVKGNQPNSLNTGTEDKTVSWDSKFWVPVSSNSQQTQGGEPNAYLEISNSFDEFKLDYMLAEGVGVSASFYAKGNYSIFQKDGKYYFSASAGMKTLAANSGDVTPQAKASIMVNGKQTQSISFAIPDGTKTGASLPVSGKDARDLCLL